MNEHNESVKTEHAHEHKHHIKCEGCDHDEHEEDVPLGKIILSAILLIFAVVLENIKLGDFIKNVPNIEEYQKYAFTFANLAAYLLVGYNVVKSAIYNLFHGEIFDEKFLMSVASLSAVCIGQLPEAVAIMLFYQIGERFEDYAVGKSEKSINSLMKIRPDTANVLRGGNIQNVKAEEVQIGETVIVKPGERIPVDGIITKGSSFVDNSTLTGESVPVEVFEGSEVFSGAINKNSVIEIKTSRISSESAASRIIKLVEFSNEKKTKTERFITRFSKVYTPVVCALAVAVAIIPTVLIGLAKGEWQWSTWVYRAISFLVVSCPCAIVISVPLTFFGGIGAASRNGILMKGSSALESLCNTKTAVFDKTGTLTKGVFEVTEICPATSDISKEQLIAIAAHAEVRSNHPVAKSINAAHSCELCGKQNISGAEEIAGHGIKVTLNGKEVLAGNVKLMQKNNIPVLQKDLDCDKSGTVIFIAEEKKYLGYIVISDQIKSDAKTAIKNLKKAGVSKIVMLTGDNKKSAEKAAAELGITDVFPELLPQDKVSKVEILLNELKGSKGKVAFAGDGINDAPVLARADVGVAMGALGSDAAIESADVVIMTDEPSKLADSIRISKRTLRIVYQNLVFSIGIKALIMILSGIGIGTMWLAVFGDVGVSFVAVLNSMRALGYTSLRKTTKK